MDIRFLNVEEAAAYRELRLEALRESPTAFCSSFEQEADFSLEKFAAKLRPDNDPVNGVFAAFPDGGRLVGILGYSREGRPKRRHIATLWGMYVLPGFRGRGIGSALLDAALSHAHRPGGARKIILAVTLDNLPAYGLYRSRGFETFGLECDAMCVDGGYFHQEHMCLYLDDTGKAGVNDTARKSVSD